MVNISKGATAVAVSLVPGIAQVKAFIDSAYEGMGAEWKAAATSEYQDWIAKLEARLQELEVRLREQQKELEQIGPLRLRSLFEQWFRDISQADTDEKREAVTNATVNRFDPDWQTPSVREYWLTQVRLLEDLEIALLKRLAPETEVAHDGSEGVLHFSTKGSRETSKEDDDMAVALGEAMEQLIAKGYLSNCGRNAHGGRGTTIQFYRLSGKGKAIGRALAPA